MASKPRLSVLTNRSQFVHLLKTGQRVRPSEWLLLNFIANSEGRMRCGWTLPRQVGSAVIRNRLKRWARVYFRNRLNTGGGLPLDINLVFRKAENDFYKKLDYEKFALTMDKGWREVERRTARVLPKPSPPIPRRV